MTDHDTARFPDHHVIVTGNNIEQVRRTLPEDQRGLIRVGCVTWRMPEDVDTWAEPMGATLTYWPEDARGALHEDGSLDGSQWGVWHGGELWLQDGYAVDVTGRILRIILGEHPHDHPDTASPDQHPNHGDDHG